MQITKKLTKDIIRACKLLVNKGFLEEMRSKTGTRFVTYRPTKKGYALLRLIERNIHLLE